MYKAELLYIILFPLLIVYIIYLVKIKKSYRKIFVEILFFIYIAILLGITIFPIPGQEFIKAREFGGLKNNYIPFASIYEIITTNDRYIATKQICGNIVLFIPFGFYTYFKKEIGYKKVIIFGILFSLIIEIIQATIGFILDFNYRAFDVDDIILNTFGFLLGYICFEFVKEFKIIKYLQK